ncbi:MAG: hypothetical protein CMG00_07385 [Candidatus Marinimicrobia bacterium]|nr:hypothetical protein [Candidatus Neomarinimicrobiota bacterium]|tara:strand:+ start:7563 stop:7874 length:312 start_codon:yes stop_codon:yes gene_type:complete
MKLACFTIILTSLIAVYSASIERHSSLAKIIFTVPEISDLDIKKSIYNELQKLNGVENNNINSDAGFVEIIVDYNEFSIQDFKTSLDKWGCAFEDYEIEDVYH